MVKGESRDKRETTFYTFDYAEPNPVRYKYNESPLKKCRHRHKKSYRFEKDIFRTPG